MKKRYFHAAGKKVLTWIYPPRCVICDRILRTREAGCCPECTPSLPWAEEPLCMSCGKLLGSMEEEYCEDCRIHGHYFTQGRGVFLYEGGVRRSLYRIKFQNRRDYLSFYGKAVCISMEKYWKRWKPEVIVPVPMHPRKKRKRGYNQSELLAEEISRLTGIPTDRRLLRCVRLTAEQKSLDRKGRQANLYGCFRAEPGQKIKRRILVIDDVYTTGSTMDEVSRVLKNAGAEAVYFTVLCTGKQAGKRKRR